MKVVVAVGGTGGHLIPASQLAQKLMRRKVDVLFAGKGLTASAYFETSQIPFVEIASSAILKKKIFSTIFSLSKGIWQSLKLLWKEKPDVVVGFGSFHSFPVLFAAKLWGIPLVLYESNRILGKVNRLFAKSAKLVAIQFPLLNPPKSGKVVKVPYLPWEMKKKSDGSLNLNAERLTFLVFGGSQGAKALNETFLQAVKLLKKKIPFQVIHLTGKEEEAIRAFYEREKIDHYVKGFEKRMDLAYESADVVICRSGAATVAELIRYEKPSILIPYPYASENHQEKNADFMAQSISGGVKILESDLTPQSLMEAILSLDERKRKEAIQKFKKDEELKVGLDEWILKIMKATIT